ncbi:MULTISPECIES: hypothetical protein [unclassified Actinomyces]|uniref:hypothetical protein n=1 Tax=unclassified Actinomyces TaxID=2609248 RepID=UPI00201810AC|nr:MULTISPECIES: hypothetical protein [unclassified Actinomyces]MCL3776841.1 hypothetical protein [Actinomyces sp. AC-20-1]MCL3790732.1 hypothetical protein [Actinomyces sp. 187325]MCL3792784.1 hypothetical protein [Actinomyces sp. 186855]MCL3795542.1 hypothetical protein [Actinomyces sp. 217892]
MRLRHPLATASAVAIMAAGVLLSPAALAAQQPSLECNGFTCANPIITGGVSAAYTTDQPGPDTVWGTPQVGLAETPADALDVEPGSTVTRTYEVTIPSQVSPTSPHRVSLLIENGTGLFSVPLDMRLHVTDAAGTELPGGTCTPAEQRLNAGEQVTVTCTVPEGGTRVTAFRRGSYGGEQLAAWTLASQTQPTPAAPATAPAVTVDGQSVAGTVDADGTWRGTAVVTRQAPDTNGAEATHTPEVTVDCAPVTAPSFRVTTKAAPAPVPSPTQSATGSEQDPTASASATEGPTAAAVSATASSRPQQKGSGTGSARLAATGPQTLGALTFALVLVGAGALSLRRTRRA